MKCCFQYTILLIKKKKSNRKGCSSTAGLQQTAWGKKKKAATIFPEIQNLQWKWKVWTYILYFIILTGPTVGNLNEAQSYFYV